MNKEEIRLNSTHDDSQPIPSMSDDEYRQALRQFAEAAEAPVHSLQEQAAPSATDEREDTLNR